MTDIQIYTKLSNLSSAMKQEVSEFIDYLNFKSRKKNPISEKRTAGKAKGLIKIKENFDDPIEGFNDYLK